MRGGEHIADLCSPTFYAATNFNYQTIAHWGLGWTEGVRGKCPVRPHCSNQQLHGSWDNLPRFLPRSDSSGRHDFLRKAVAPRLTKSM